MGETKILLTRLISLVLFLGNLSFLPDDRFLMFYFFFEWIWLGFIAWESTKYMPEKSRANDKVLNTILASFGIIIILCVAGVLAMLPLIPDTKLMNRIFLTAFLICALAYLLLITYLALMACKALYYLYPGKNKAWLLTQVLIYPLGAWTLSGLLEYPPENK